MQTYVVVKFNAICSMYNNDLFKTFYLQIFHAYTMYSICINNMVCKCNMFHFCSDGSSSFLEVLFKDWVDQGMIVRLDIRHWLHRWDAVVIKQTHAKYGPFMSALAGAVLAYNR